MSSRRIRHQTGAALLVVATVALASCSSGSGQSQKSIDAASFGTMKNVCHEAVGKNVPNSDRGVTADTIRITTISDAGSEIQLGLNQELWDASHVFVDWCNENGGINGRRIHLTEGDAKVTQYQQTVEDACVRTFALVGGGGALDQTGQESRVKCLLPSFPGFQASTAARASDLTFPGMPTPNNQVLVGMQKQLTSEFPDTVSHVGYVYGDFPSVAAIVDQTRAAGEEQLGWQAVSEQKYPIFGVDTWIPYAQQLATDKVQGLVFGGQPADLASLLVAIRASGYNGIKWVYTDANSYDKLLIAKVGGNLDTMPVYTALSEVPFEEADGTSTESKAIARYLELSERYLPEGKSRALLGVRSFESWLLFAQAADACGTNLTRKCMVGKNGTVRKITGFTAGGLIGPSNPTAGVRGECFVGVKAMSHGFAVTTGDKKSVFDCDPGNVMKVTTVDVAGKYGKGVTLADVGKSLTDLP